MEAYWVQWEVSVVPLRKHHDFLNTVTFRVLFVANLQHLNMVINFVYFYLSGFAMTCLESHTTFVFYFHFLICRFLKKICSLWRGKSFSISEYFGLQAPILNLPQTFFKTLQTSVSFLPCSCVLGDGCTQSQMHTCDLLPWNQYPFAHFELVNSLCFSF